MYWLLFEPPGVNILVGVLLLAVDVVVGADSSTNIASARDNSVVLLFAFVAAKEISELSALQFRSIPAHWNTGARCWFTESTMAVCCCFRETTEYTSAHCDSSR